MAYIKGYHRRKVEEIEVYLKGLLDSFAHGVRSARDEDLLQYIYEAKEEIARLKEGRITEHAEQVEKLKERREHSGLPDFVLKKEEDYFYRHIFEKHYQEIVISWALFLETCRHYLGEG